MRSILAGLCRPGFLCTVAIFCGAYVSAHVRLIYSVNGNALFWDDPDDISIVINSAGSDDIADGSHETSIRNAIAAWNADDETDVLLVEDTDPQEQARTDWNSSGIHLVLFDENNSSGYFPGSSGTVAVTPVTFFTNGQIIDADVIYNGKDFAFTTSGQAGRFDVQDVGTHELGHLLGLDHSGWAGATMYPYVDQSVILHRSLSIDDVRGMRHVYPNGTFSTITGSVRRATGGAAVEGAHIVAVDSNGRTAGAILSDDDGDFTLRALSADTYTVYAVPLDFPVSDANLGAGHVIETDFEATVFGSFVVGVGASVDIGNRDVDDDVAISLGRNADDYPLRAIAGQTTGLLVRGTGLLPGSTLTPSDPSVTVTPTTWNGTSVAFDVDVLGGAAPGHIDLTVTDGSGDTDVLVAGIEITPPDPTIATVTPSSGDAAGGTAVTLIGTGFVAGARVVLGDQIYVDGEVDGCTVVDSGTITLTTLATVPGLHDVVVIDSTGVEGRMVDGYQMAAIPTITAVFPVAGQSVGGTTVAVTGTEFVAGATVTIDGVPQPNVTVNGLTDVTIVTEPGTPGGPYVLTVTNPGGAFASSAFTYTLKNDPTVTLVTPDKGNKKGGKDVTVTGTDFTTDSTVIFGADESTGLGGTIATSVVFVDANTLQVVTPASTSGWKTVLVRETDTLQGSLLMDAYKFVNKDSGGGGGGGCAAVAPGGPPSWREITSSGAWVVVTLALAVALARRERVLVVVER